MKTTLPPLPGRVDAGSTPAAPERHASHSLQVNIDGLDLSQLLELRSRVDAKLPARKLKDIDLEEELVRQLLHTQELQRKILSGGDNETPANQMAQVSNAVQSALQNLVKMQGDAYTSERLKKIEQILIECIKDLPVEEQDKFLTRYEQRLGSVR